MEAASAVPEATVARDALQSMLRRFDGIGPPHREHWSVIQLSLCRSPQSARAHGCLFHSLFLFLTMISLVGTFVLVHGFSALLPPIPEGEVSYYDIMDVPPSASQEDIRKAYKKISLRLHPDKVAQRRGGNAEEAREEYQKVQEAYAVLSHSSKRQRYDVLQRSPTRYQFVSTGMNPGAMYENLARASFCDKSRLVVLAFLLCCLLLLQPILIASKINQELREEGVLYETMWVLVLIPWWLFYGLVVVLAQFVVFSVTHKGLFLLAFFEHAAWFVGEFFLALRWDGSILWDYKVVFIPIYVALALRWTHKMLRLQKIHNALQRMVTLDYLEQHILEGGRRYQDLTEEEIHDIAQQYVVVHVPPVAAQETDEEVKVQASPEYEQAADAYTELVNSLIEGIFVNTSFVALVVAKVDGAISVSWWVVFVPIWVNLGLTILASVYTCCCVPNMGSEVIVDNDESEKEGSDDGDKDRDADPAFADVEASIRGGSIQLPLQDAAEANSTATPDKEPDSKKDITVDESKSKTDESRTDKKVKRDEISKNGAQQEEVKESEQEETKEPDVVEDIPTGAYDGPGIHIDEDMFHEFESAYQEAEESAMEAQAKSQANCCSALFQLTMFCLLVGKLEQDYMRGENESPGYNAFWILFPIFLVFGCAMCMCGCLIYTAGESEGFDHLVERVSTTNKEHVDEEETPTQQEESNGDVAAASKDELSERVKQETAEESKEQQVETTHQDPEIHDLD